MAIPDYQSIMLPFLLFANDAQEHSFRDAKNLLSEQFGLTDEERKELLPSGKQSVFIRGRATLNAYGQRICVEKALVFGA